MEAKELSRKVIDRIEGEFERTTKLDVATVGDSLKITIESIVIELKEYIDNERGER